MAVLPRATYSAVVRAVVEDLRERSSGVPASFGDVLSRMLDSFPAIPRRTLGSIMSLAVQRVVKSHHINLSSSGNVKTMVEEFKAHVAAGCPPGIILRMGDQLQVPPAIIARFLVDDYASGLESNDHPKQMVKKLLEDPELITDRDLKYEVWLAHTEDSIYGPYCDLIACQIGADYEKILRTKLEERGISFMDEDAMRVAGFDRTPDFKMVVPFAMGDFIVNWIESKASFGDEETVEDQYREQFAPYANRFGSGLVIYWFGYIDDMDKHVGRGVKLALDVPENITPYEPEKSLEKMLHDCVKSWEEEADKML